MFAGGGVEVASFVFVFGTADLVMPHPSEMIAALGVGLGASAGKEQARLVVFAFDAFGLEEEQRSGFTSVFVSEIAGLLVGFESAEVALFFLEELSEIPTSIGEFLTTSALKEAARLFLCVWVVAFVSEEQAEFVAGLAATDFASFTIERVDLFGCDGWLCPSTRAAKDVVVASIGVFEATGLFKTLTSLCDIGWE